MSEKWWKTIEKIPLQIFFNKLFVLSSAEGQGLVKGLEYITNFTYKIYDLSPETPTSNMFCNFATKDPRSENFNFISEKIILDTEIENQIFIGMVVSNVVMRTLFILKANTFWYFSIQLQPKN